MSQRIVYWSDMPPELLSKIAEYLDTRSDTQTFRSVCKSWKRSVPLHILTSKNILSPLFPYHVTSWLDTRGPSPPILVATSVFMVRSRIDPELPPWLFVAEELHPRKLIISKFLSPIAIEMLPTDFPRKLDLSHIQVSELAAFHRLRSVDDPKGMIGNKSLPEFNDNRVVLFVNRNCSTIYPTIGDCTAIVLHHNGDLRAIRLEDKQEFDVNYQGSRQKFDDIVNFKEHIYAIDRRGRVYKIYYDTLLMIALIKKPLQEIPSKKRRLAVSNDQQELYLIYRCCRYENGISFSVYKLNKNEKKWVEVNGIGDDKILFVTYDGSFFASVEDFRGWKGNCIVFYKGCFTSYGRYGRSPLCDHDCSLFSYDFKSDYCHCLSNSQRGLFWPPPAWLSSSARTSTHRETIRRTSSTLELRNAIEDGENKCTHQVVSKNYKGDNSTAKFKGLRDITNFI